MAANVETMAHVKSVVPWWGLGEFINASMILDEMLHVAKLDNENNSEVLYVQRNGVFVPLDSSLNKDNSDYRAIIRQSDNYVHSVMTKDYHVVQNREIVEFLREYIEAGGMTMETLGALKHGSIVWALAKIDKTFTLPGNDTLQNYVLISTSHDGTQETMGQYTNVCVVCQNTLRMAQGAKKGRSFSIRHTGKMTPEIVKAAKEHMMAGVRSAESFAELADSLSQVKVDRATTLEFVAKLVQPELLAVKKDETVSVSLDSIIDMTAAKYIDITDFKRVGKAILNSIEYGTGQELESRKDTVWGLLNGVTHYVDHEAGRNRDTALTSAWFGAGATLKDEALKLAVSMTR